MDYRGVFKVAAAGMSLEKQRVDVAALNLANMSASASPGQVFRPMQVVASPIQAAFADWMSDQPQSVAGVQWGGSDGSLRSVQLAPQQVPERLVHDPSHPHADEQGMVRYPGVNHAQEMITVMSAVRAYEANLSVASSAKAMVLKALELGGQG